MPFDSRRLRLQVWCGATTVHHCMTPTVRPCPNHSCFQFGSPCYFGSCGMESPVVVCPPASDPCFGSPVIDAPETPWAIPQDPIAMERDPENPDRRDRPA
jgi:hypothetical protein